MRRAGLSASAELLVLTVAVSLNSPAGSMDRTSLTGMICKQCVFGFKYHFSLSFSFTLSFSFSF